MRRKVCSPVMKPRCDAGRATPAAVAWQPALKNPETGEPVISCTIIVTDANELTRPIHDRMPVILDKVDIGRWLSGDAGIGLLV